MNEDEPDVDLPPIPSAEDANDSPDEVEDDGLGADAPEPFDPGEVDEEN